MKSRLYVGRLRHRRHQPRRHAFSYRVYMPFICLDELPELFDNNLFWSARRRAFAEFRRSDFLGDPEQPLATEVRRRIFTATGANHRGPIYLLANLRYFGYNINPIACYYCYNEDETKLEYLVAEVTNTPWKERHSYVLSTAESDRWLRQDFSKRLHVSPFNPMAMRYHWRSNRPEHRLVISLATTTDNVKVFDASLNLVARPLTAAALSGILWRFPLMSLKVVLAIYWQALRLWLKRTPVYPHPESNPNGVIDE